MLPFSSKRQYYFTALVKTHNRDWQQPSLGGEANPETETVEKWPRNQVSPFRLGKFWEDVLHYQVVHDLTTWNRGDTFLCGHIHHWAISPKLLLVYIKTLCFVFRDVFCDNQIKSLHVKNSSLGYVLPTGSAEGGADIRDKTNWFVLWNLISISLLSIFGS